MVSIYDLKLISLYKDILTINVNCGSGTYIRSLAHEIGELLGCGASVKGLKRTGIGSFGLKSSIDLKDFVERKIKKINLRSSPYMISIERLLDENPSLYIEDKYRDRILNGHPVSSEMIDYGRIKAGSLFKKGILVKIKDSGNDFMAVHRVLRGNAAIDIEQNGLALTKSILVFGN